MPARRSAFELRQDPFTKRRHLVELHAPRRGDEMISLVGGERLAQHPDVYMGSEPLP